MGKRGRPKAQKQEDNPTKFTRDITYNDGTGTITFAAELASSTNKGVASFDATEFSVSTGVVTVGTIDGGTF